MAGKPMMDFIPAGLMDTCPDCGAHVLRGARDGKQGVYHVEDGAATTALHEGECPGRKGRDLQTLVKDAEGAVARQRTAEEERDAARILSPAEYVLMGGDPAEEPKATRALRKEAEQQVEQQRVAGALAPAAEAAYLRREGTDKPRDE